MKSLTVAIIILLGLVAVQAMAVARPTAVKVTIVVNTHFNGDPAEVLEITVPGCTTLTTTVTDQSGPQHKELGSMDIFTGEKLFDCEGAGTFILEYRATTDLEKPDVWGGDVGVWKVTDGTGDFAGAQAHGRLVGTAFEDGSGITDAWSGVMTLRN